MRINMTPVASATPNDVAPGSRGKNRRRGRGRPGGPGPVRSIVATGGVPVGGNPHRPPSPIPPAVGQEGAPGEGPSQGKKRRRRRRRKRRGGEGQGAAQFDPAAPVHFFSVEGRQPGGGGNGTPGPNGQKRRRRRRRRRGRGNRPDMPAGSGPAPGGDSNGQSMNHEQAPPPPAAPDGESRDGE
jgi:hypothetical protein